MTVKIVIMVSHHPLPACPVFIFYPFYARKLLYNEASLAFDYLYAFVYLLLSSPSGLILHSSWLFSGVVRENGLLSMQI